MSGLEEGEEMQTLFQCKLCDYVSHTKAEIADHFISAHASIEVIESPVKSRTGRRKEAEVVVVKSEVQSDGSGDGERTPATTPVKRNSPRRTPLRRTPKSTPTKDKQEESPSRRTRSQSNPQEDSPLSTRSQSKPRNVGPSPRTRQKPQDNSPSQTTRRKPQKDSHSSSTTKLQNTRGKLREDSPSPSTRQTSLKGSPSPSTRQNQLKDSPSPIVVLQRIEQEESPSQQLKRIIQELTPSSQSTRPQRKRRAPKWLEEAEVELPVTKKTKEKHVTNATPSPKRVLIPKKEKVQDDQERIESQDGGQEGVEREVEKELATKESGEEQVQFVVHVSELKTKERGEEETVEEGLQKEVLPADEGVAQVDGSIDVSQGDANTESSQVDDNTESSQVNANTESSQVGCNAESSQVDANTDLSQGDGNTESSQVDGNADVSQVVGNTDVSRVDDNTDLSQVDDNTESSHVDGNTESCQGDADTDLSQGNGNTESSQVDGNADVSQVVGNTDVSRVDDNTDVSQVVGNTESSQVDGNTESGQVDANTDVKAYLTNTDVNDPRELNDADLFGDDVEMDSDAELDNDVEDESWEPEGTESMDEGTDAAIQKNDKPDPELGTTEAEWKKLFNHHNVPITSEEFQDKVGQAFSEWESAHSKEHKLDTIVCSKPECDAAVFERETELHESCHMRDYHGFECLYCDERFSQWKMMRKHFANCHVECTEVPKHWQCDQCTKTCRIIEGLKRHVKEDHVVPETAKSILASFALSQLGEDGQPKKRGPGRPKTFKMKPKVRKTPKYKTKRELNGKPPREKRLSLKWMPRCGKCSAVYDTTEELDNHIVLHETVEEGKLSCTECKDNFTPDELRDHMKKEHRRKINPFRCVLCEFSSDRRHDVKKHMYCHEGVKRFQCHICGNLMSTPYNLKIHRMRVHATEAEKTILCTLCGFKCANRAVLKDHMRHKHDLCMSGQSRATSQVEYPTFPCTQCDYVGKKESSLKYHMRLHTENRPFKCQMCSYASKTKNNLILHVRTHNGMAPNKCPHCDFTGATTLIVKEHIMAKHTKEKPLKCSLCDWSTCYNGNLWKHMQMHKLENGILLPGKPKRATRKGIRYEEGGIGFGKLLPITIDGLVEPTPEEVAEVREVERASRLVNIPINIGNLGTTIMVLPRNELPIQQSMSGEEASTLVTLETGQQQTGNGTQMISFNPAEPQQAQVALTGESGMNSIQFEVAEQTQGSNEITSEHQQQVMISVAGQTNVQQSISSIMSSMAASAAAASQQTTSHLVGNTLIETQLSASEVASQFEDGTIIEITQIPTSGDGTALIPEGAIVERIAPGMSASDIIMKAANMVAAGQVGSRGVPCTDEYLVPMALSRVTENTLPFLAHVATTQESLAETETATLQIIERLEGNVVTQESADSGEILGSQGEIVEQFVATMLPDGSNMMQIMQPSMQDE